MNLGQSENEAKPFLDGEKKKFETSSGEKEGKKKDFQGGNSFLWSRVNHKQKRSFYVSQTL